MTVRERNGKGRQREGEREGKGGWYQWYGVKGRVRWEGKEDQVERCKGERDEGGSKESHRERGVIRRKGGTEKEKGKLGREIWKEEWKRNQGRKSR